MINTQYTLNANYQELFGENPAIFQAIDFNGATNLVTICPVGIDRLVYNEAIEVYRTDLIEIPTH